MANDQTKPDAATREFEQRDAKAQADGGPVPTPEEEAAAERADVGDLGEVAEHYDDMLDKGANHPGEGRIP